MTGQGDPVNLSGVVVTAKLFPLLGVAPQLGRSFTPEEDRAGNRAVLLSHSLWQNRFNSDPNVAGKTITINSQNYNVAGVMPAGFKDGPPASDILQTRFISIFVIVMQRARIIPRLRFSFYFYSSCPAYFE